MLKIFVIVLLIRINNSCTPFGQDSLAMLGASGAELSRPSVTNNNLFPTSSFQQTVRARGEQTQSFPNGIPNGVAKAAKKDSMSVSLGTPSTPPILDASELNCSEFDETCRWRNVDGMFVDELDWYQGSGELDQARLSIATATSIIPEGSYAIAATDIVQFPNIKAVLVSDQISCQIGDGEIRFQYWTSPEVQIKVCTKKMSKVYPDFDFCSSPIDKNDPGPVFVNLPEQGPVPFQIYIIADHFTFNSANLKGGFAIIDSIEYYAKMCDAEGRASFDPTISDSALPLIPMAENRDDGQQIESFHDSNHVTVKRESVTIAPFQLGIAKKDSSAGIFDFGDKSMESGFHHPTIKLFKSSSNEVSNEENEQEVSTACEVIVCSFNETEACTNMVHQSDWQLSTGPVGNPLTGVRGDASTLPYNEEGSFAYISGPQLKSRLQTPSFIVDRPVTIVFSYYKADKSSNLEVFLKPSTGPEKSIFQAPKLSKNSRRWFRESLNIIAGNYDQLSFEVSNLRPNHYIGIDEMFIVDDRRKSFCFNFH